MKKNITKILSIVLVLITIFSTCAIAFPVSAANINVGSAKPGSYYTIYNVGSKKMLNVYASRNASNTPVTVFSKDYTPGQSVTCCSHGTMYYNGVKFTTYYFVFKCAPSCALNVVGSYSRTGSQISIHKKTGNDTQDWILEYIPSKQGYIIRSANNPKLVLTATGSANSSKVCLKSYNSTNNYQVWQSGMFTHSASTSNSAPSSSSAKSRTLPINWSLIKSTGKQSRVEKNCLCRALAYCRDIIDGYAHKWTEYSEGYIRSYGRYSYTAVCSKAGYTKKTSTSQATVYKTIYDNIQKGKPVVINVDDGAGKRSTGCHYVAVVGYVNVTNTSKLSASNFLIIDSVGTGGYTTENLGSLGYSLLKNSSGRYTYYVD